MSMSEKDVEKVANQVRRQLDEKACCGIHAIEVLFTVIGSFVLDEANDVPGAAADHLLREANSFAQSLRNGGIIVRRPLNG